jgi:hypothetical protein
VFTFVKIRDTVSSLVDALARMALLPTGINCEQSGNNDEDSYELQVPTFGEALSHL